MKKANKTVKKNTKKKQKECSKGWEPLIDWIEMMDWQLKDANENTYAMSWMSADVVDLIKHLFENHESLMNSDWLREQFYKCQLKKPIINYFEHCNDVEYVCEWECPRCGKGYRTEAETYDYYCPNCGQKLDWSEIDD